MDIEEALRDANGFGLYQKTALFFLSLQALYNGLQSSVVNMISPAQEHWCLVDRLEHFPHHMQKELAIPSGNEAGSYDSCHYFNLPWANFTDEQILALNRSFIESIASIETCDNWVFNQETFTRTMLTEFHTVCSTGFLAQLASTLYAAGLFVGNLFHGPMSDMFGRKVASLTFSVLLSGSLFACAWCPDPIALAVLRMFVGLLTRATSSSCYVLLAEITGPKYRAIGGNAFTSVFAAGMIVQAALAFALRDYVHLHIITGALALANLGLYFIVVESPRWLLSKGRVEEAEEAIQWMAHVNNSPLPEDFQLRLPKTQEDLESIDEKDPIPSKDSKDSSNTDIKNQSTRPPTSVLVTNPTLRKSLFLITYSWFVANFAHMGITMNLSTLTGNIYMTMLVSGAMEVPVGFICFFAMNRFGRKPVLWVCGILMLLVNIAAAVLEIWPETRIGATILSLTARAAASGIIAVLYTLVSELFPTALRQRALGICNFGSAAGIIAPFLGELKVVFPPSMNIFLSVFSFFFVVLVNFFPETIGKKIPETVEEAERNGKGNNPLKSEVIGTVVAEEPEYQPYSVSTDKLWTTHF